MMTIGHNSTDTTRLKSYIDRIERLEQEKADLQSDIKDIYTEAKSIGFDVKIMRKIVRIRKIDPQKVEQEDELIAVYKAALNM